MSIATWDCRCKVADDAPLQARRPHTRSGSHPLVHLPSLLLYPLPPLSLISSRVPRAWSRTLGIFLFFSPSSLSHPPFCTYSALFSAFSP